MYERSMQKTQYKVRESIAKATDPGDAAKFKKGLDQLRKL